MSTKNLDKLPEVIEIVEVVELYLGSRLVSDTVLSKQEQHGDVGVKNTYAFDCTKTDVKLFEKTVISTPTVNKNITAEVVDVKCGLDGSKTIYVEFYTA